MPNTAKITVMQIVEPEQFTLGLHLPATISFDEWADIGRKLCMGLRTIQWLIGDWLIQGSERFGEEARAEANRIFRSDVERFAPIVDTCRRFPETKRHDSLTFGHHLAVMEVKDDQEAETLLRQAEASKMLVRDLRARVRDHRLASGTLFPQVDDDPEDTAMRAIARAWNCAPKAARESFLALAEEAELGVIEL